MNDIGYIVFFLGLGAAFIAWCFWTANRMEAKREQ